MAEFTSLNGYDVKDKKAVRVYDNVEAMKEDYSIQAGQTVQTLGYYEPNDGGSAEYIISDDNTLTPDESLIIQLENGLFAKLIIKNNTINVKQLGAYGDGVHDDTLIIQKAIDYCITNKLKLESPAGENYLITSSLTFSNRVDIDFNGSSVITNNAIDMLVFNYTSGNENQGYLKNIIIDMNGVATIGIHATRVVKKLITGIEIRNISNIGYQIDVGNEVIFENSHLYGTTTSTTSIGLKLNKGDCHYKDLIMIDVHTAILASSTNFYSRIHAWIKTPTLIPGSIFMKCDTNSTHFLNQCYSDTYGYAFYISADVRLKLTEHYNFNNAVIMTPQTIADNGGYIYMFYYTDASYSRGTTISNSKIQGYPDDITLAKFTNISQDNLLCFVDPLTYVVNWGDGNFKNNAIPVSNSDITGSDFDLVTSYANKYTVSGCTVTLNIKLKANKFIASGTSTKLFNIPQKYRPTSETVFIVPTSLSTYGVKNIAFIYIVDNGNVYFVANGDTNSNDLVIINHTYVTDGNQP